MAFDHFIHVYNIKDVNPYSSLSSFQIHPHPPQVYTLTFKNSLLVQMLATHIYLGAVHWSMTHLTWYQFYVLRCFFVVVAMTKYLTRSKLNDKTHYPYT